MKGSGTFRGIRANVRKTLNLFTRTRTYNDPVFDAPERSRRAPLVREIRRRLNPPPCIPGTVTYRDRLVKHLGYDRREADRMLKLWTAQRYAEREGIEYKGEVAELPEL